MLSFANHLIRRYAVAILAVAVASLWAEMSTPWMDIAQSFFLLLLGAVMVSAWLGGLRSGLLTTVLGAVISSYFFLAPIRTFTLDSANLARVSLFMLQGLLVSVGCELLHKAKRQAESDRRSQLSSAAQAISILDCITDSVVLLDREWRLSYVNNHAEIFLGVPRADLLGQRLWEVFPEWLGSPFDQQVRQAVDKQMTVTIEAHFPASERWASERCASVRVYPSPEGVVLYLQDLSLTKCLEPDREEHEQAIALLNHKLAHRLEALQQSEARYDRLVANVPGVMYQFRLSADRQRSDFPYIGPGCFELFEFGVEDMQQHPELIWDAIHPDDLATFQQSLDADSPTGAQWQHEWRIFTRSGQLKWVRGVSRAERQADGSVMWDGILMDISEQKQFESRFRRIFESNMIGINFADPEGRIVFANDAFLNLIGYTQTDLRQNRLNWRDISPPESLAIDDQAAIALIQNGVCLPYEKEYIRKDGSRIPVIVGAAKLESPDQGCICFVVDIRDRKQLENQLRQQTTDLERANRAKDEFFAILSHELRTPLNSILGWSQLLQNRKFDQQTVDQALVAIERNAQTQAQLIDDLLDIARILQGKLDLKICPVNVMIPIEAAIAKVRPIMHQKAIRLTLTIVKASATGAIELLESFELNEPLSHLNPELQIPRFVMSGDAKRIQQVVWNLLANAAKFTAEGGRIDVSLKHLGSEMQIEVQDTGLGIAPQSLTEIFAPLHQADSTNTRRFGGLGLGLTIVRQLVELHGGTVKAESPGEGQGATFIVKLPLSNHRQVARSFRRAALSSGDLTSRQDE